MLKNKGFNKWITKKDRWREECFSLTGYTTRKGGRILKLRGQYIRTVWDWFVGRRRVPEGVAKEMLRAGVINQYIPVEGLDMVLVKCDITAYGIYMDYYT